MPEPRFILPSKYTEDDPLLLKKMYVDYNADDPDWDDYAYNPVTDPFITAGFEDMFYGLKTLPYRTNQEAERMRKELETTILSKPLKAEYVFNKSTHSQEMTPIVPSKKEIENIETIPTHILFADTDTLVYLCEGYKSFFKEATDQEGCFNALTYLINGLTEIDKAQNRLWEIQNQALLEPKLLPPLNDPILEMCSEPTTGQKEKIIKTIIKLLDYAKTSKYILGNTDFISSPEKWLILEKQAPFGMGFAIGAYGVIYREALDSDYLPAVIAHILGWFNHGLTKIIPSYFIQAVRNASASFNFERLPNYTKSSQELIIENKPYLEKRFGIQINGEDVYDEIPSQQFIKARTTDTLKTTALPESLRPKPVDVLLGGGNNYTNFGYKQTHDYSADIITSEDDSARGIIATMEYLESLPQDTTENLVMKEYFKNRKKWAKFFQLAQEHADGYATNVFGQGNQLAELLTRFEKLYSADGANTLHFYQSLTKRIDRLTNTTGALTDFFRF